MSTGTITGFDDASISTKKVSVHSERSNPLIFLSKVIAYESIIILRVTIV